MSYAVKRLIVGALDTNCYILKDGEKSGAVVIDPGGDGARIKGALRGMGVFPALVLLTHGHFDHILALDEVRTDETVVCLHEKDAEGLLRSRLVTPEQIGCNPWPFGKADLLFGCSGHSGGSGHSGRSGCFEGSGHFVCSEGSVCSGRSGGSGRSGCSKGSVHFEAGGFGFEVLHTPGHTEGSVCFVFGSLLFTGDTLFCGSIGRTDLPGGDCAEMERSLALLYNLPGDYAVYPGHGSETTLSAERLHNPYLRRSCCL